MNGSWLMSILAQWKNQSFDIYEIELAWKDMIGVQSYRYEDFYHAVIELERNNKIESVKSKSAKHRNGKTPSLPIYWRKIKSKAEPRWELAEMVKVAPVIDLSYYQEHPECQTDDTWRRIKAIADFLLNPASKSYVEREERSYQLFGDEKWLKKEGNQFLKRIKTKLSDLYVIVSSEPFVCWLKPRLLLEDVKDILIVENHAIYHTCRRLLQEGYSICGLSPDLLIYGEGDHITSSISYLEELRVPVKSTVIHYSGDFDPSGFAIYGSLRRVYPHYPIRLALPIYEQTARNAHTAVQVKPGQTQNIDLAQTFFDDISCNPIVRSAAQRAWKERIRLPQEALSYEILLKELIK